jgi:GT2 family glycosyltransferase
MKAAAVVVNFNGGQDLRRCLAALVAQTVPLDVVVVDCASTDGSRELALAPPPGVRGVPLAANEGFAGGCAAGFAAVSPEAEVIAFFNPDCFPTPGFFSASIAALGHAGVGGVAPRLLRPGGSLLDSCGQVLSPLALRVRDRGYGRPAEGAFTGPEPVLAACGAAMVYDRRALAAAAVDGEVFPREFFAFWEDLDLGWRVNNAGYEVRYVPAAVAEHRRGATASPGRGRLIFRRTPDLAARMLVNRWATLLRNLHWLDFVVRLPVLLVWDLAMLVLIVLRSPRVPAGVLRELPRLRLARRQRRSLRQRRLRELA